MGAWYAYKGTQLAQGREKTKTYLESNTAMATEIEQAIRDRLLHGKGEEMLEEEEGGDEKVEEGNE